MSTQSDQPRPPGPEGPDTVVLVHGLWMTPRSWEHWVPHLEARGYRVLTPGTRASRSRSRPCARTPR